MGRVLVWAGLALFFSACGEPGGPPDGIETAVAAARNRCRYVVCTALDQCHLAGTCNPNTGICSNPTKPDGTSCNDGSLCTQPDTCQTGTCQGSPVTCTAQDQCHVAGACNPTTGTCSNPSAPDGTGCSDGDLCTQTDSCQGGGCAGSNPVVCTPLDQCHVVGTCDFGTGACSTPSAVDGTACSDGDACTLIDQCISGVCTGDPLTCTALDQCHVPGVCDAMTGVCSNPPAASCCGDGVIANGDVCDDGNMLSGDGCTSSCAIEANYSCLGEPSRCVQEVCGDGYIVGAEACDDANLTAGDGCDPSCSTEAGYACTGMPSTCQAICGDGVCLGAENGTGCALDCGPVVSVSAGYNSTCAILDGGSVRCWGDNSNGRLGLGDTRTRGIDDAELRAGLPAVNLGTGRTALQLALSRGGGFGHVCALLDDHSVKCWGANPYGELGTGDTTGRGWTAGQMGDSLPRVSLGTGRTAVQVAAGDEHTCALLDDGSIKCWGRSQYGQLGLGTYSTIGDSASEMGDALPRVDLGTDQHAVAVAAGSRHTCAILVGGAVKCWGNGTSGQLGYEDTRLRGGIAADMGDNLPAVNLGTGRTAIAIAAAEWNTCALLDDQTIKCWGDNQVGQLGQGDTVQRGSSPGQMGGALPAVNLGSGRTAVAVDIGVGHACAVLDDGSAKCWGSGGHLGLGSGAFLGDSPGEMGDALPALDPGTGRRVRSLVVGTYHSCASLDDHHLKCWGQNSAGQLGIGGQLTQGDEPFEMGDQLPRAVLRSCGAFECQLPVAQVASGQHHECALFQDGTVKCWGINNYGQLGLGYSDGSSWGDSLAGMGNSLRRVWLGPNRAVIAIDAGANHNCAILDDHSVKCWGQNSSGKLGLGDTANRGGSFDTLGAALPTVDLGTGRTAVALALAREHTCALLDNGTVKCWGYNGYGQLGLGDGLPRGDNPGEMGDALPAVNLGTGRLARAVTAGGQHSCAILDDGAVKCWGINHDGELGLGDTAVRGVAPSQMGDALPALNLGTGRTARAIAAGDRFTCALLDDFSLKCWGQNVSGQLGLGDTITHGDNANEMGDALPPVFLGAGRSALAVATGWNSTCAVLDDATLKCWGNNLSGQLGLGNTVSRGISPADMSALPIVNVGAGRTVLAINLGFDQTCALLDVGLVKCWGSDFAGKLGIVSGSSNRGDNPGEMGDALPLTRLGTVP
ncbi:MAG: hypothetical protein IT384_29735 [Deltaproteobacteria bacterium]|nr:hypothetical protein [Deltaproteobacteria bacterium]